MSRIDEIREVIGQGEALAQLAEEAAELTQAALKLRRVIDGNNPTPVTEEEAQNNLDEEIADVMLCLQILGKDVLTPAMETQMLRKTDRWRKRLRGRGELLEVYVGLKMSKDMERDICECRNSHREYEGMSFSGMLRELIDLGLTKIAKEDD